MATTDLTTAPTGAWQPVNVDGFDTLARTERQQNQPRPRPRTDGRRRLAGVPRTTCLVDEHTAWQAATDVAAATCTIGQAAERLGVSRGTLTNAWRRYGITRP
jgi:hypothetical protein